jgi:hypothetical protein
MQAVKPSIPAKLDLIPGLKKKSVDSSEDEEQTDDKPKKPKPDDETDVNASKEH